MIRAKLILDPKKWLGDNKIMKMDWDVKAMHFHLMLVAWQNTPQAHLETDDSILVKYLGIAISADWHERIKPQLLTVWQRHTHEGSEYYVQTGLLKEITKQNTPRKTVKKQPVENDGFNLLDMIAEDKEDIAKSKEDLKKDTATIWGTGIEILVTEEFNAAKARVFLGKLAKEYGAHTLASAITQIKSQKVNPVESRSYLVSVLRNAGYKKPFIHHNQASGRLVL